MGAGITIPLALEAEKLAMKAELGTALVTFWDSMTAASATETPTTQQQYADEFARVLGDVMFDRIVTYVSTNANVVVSGGVTVCSAGPGTITSGVGSIT